MENSKISQNGVYSVGCYRKKVFRVKKEVVLCQIVKKREDGVF